MRLLLRRMLTVLNRVGIMKLCLILSVLLLLLFPFIANSDEIPVITIWEETLIDEDFKGEFPPKGWIVESDCPDYFWDTTLNKGPGECDKYPYLPAAVFDIDIDDFCETRLISPKLKRPEQGETAESEDWFMEFDNVKISDNSQSELLVEISSDYDNASDPSWALIHDVILHYESCNMQWEHILGSRLGSDDEFRLSFRAAGRGMSAIYLDNVILRYEASRYGSSGGRWVEGTEDESDCSIFSRERTSTGLCALLFLIGVYPLIKSAQKQ